MRHNPRAFVKALDFMTTLGHGATGRERRALGVRTEGPVLVVTDLCIMKPDPDTKELVVSSLHPGVAETQVRDATAWSVKFADRLDTTDPPHEVELETLRDLNERTARAHGTTAAE